MPNPRAALSSFMIYAFVLDNSILTDNRGDNICDTTDLYFCFRKLTIFSFPKHQDLWRKIRIIAISFGHLRTVSVSFVYSMVHSSVPRM